MTYQKPRLEIEEFIKYTNTRHLLITWTDELGEETYEEIGYPGFFKPGNYPFTDSKLLLDLIINQGSENSYTYLEAANDSKIDIKVNGEIISYSLWCSKFEKALLHDE